MCLNIYIYHLMHIYTVYDMSVYVYIYIYIVCSVYIYNYSQRLTRNMKDTIILFVPTSNV